MSSVVQVMSGVVGVSPQSIAFTNPVASGNWLVALTTDTASSSVIPTITNSGANTWTQVVAQQQATNGYVAAIFYTKSTVSGNDTVISTTSGSSVGLAVFEVTGLTSGATPLSGIGTDSTTTASNSNETTASITVGGNDFCVTVAETNGSPTTPSQITGMTMTRVTSSFNAAYSPLANSVASPSTFKWSWSSAKSLMCAAVFPGPPAGGRFFPSSSKKLIRKAASRRQ